jgi:hypothetical protein
MKEREPEGREVPNAPISSPSTEPEEFAEEVYEKEEGGVTYSSTDEEAFSDYEGFKDDPDYQDDGKSKEKSGEKKGAIRPKGYNFYNLTLQIMGLLVVVALMITCIAVVCMKKHEDFGDIQ